MPWHDEARMAGLVARALGSRHRGEAIAGMSRRELLAVIAEQAAAIERRDREIERLNERLDRMEVPGGLWVERDA